MYPLDLLIIANRIFKLYDNTVTIEAVYPVPFTSLIRIKLSSFEYLTFDTKTRMLTETPIEE